MASSMVQLKHLEIMGCVNLTEIVSLNQVNNAVFEADELFNKSESMMPVADGMVNIYACTISMPIYVLILYFEEESFVNNI